MVELSAFLLISTVSSIEKMEDGSFFFFSTKKLAIGVRSLSTVSAAVPEVVCSGKYNAVGGRRQGSTQLLPECCVPPDLMATLHTSRSGSFSSFYLMQMT